MEFPSAVPTPSVPRWRRPAVALVAITAIGLALRVHYALPDAFPSVDGVFYLQQARDLVLHDRLTFSTFPPGWPFLAALPLMFMDANDPLQLLRAAQGMNIALTTAWIPLTWLLVRGRAGRWPAVGAAGVVAVLPAAVIAGKGDLSEPAYGVAILLALLVRDRDRFLCGLAVGVAYLVRPEALLVAVAWLALDAWHLRRFPWALLSGFALAAVPYVIYLHHQTGLWTFSAKSGFLAQVAAAHPGWSHLTLVGANVLDMIRRLVGMLGWPLAVLAAAGLVKRPDARYWALAALLPLPLFDFAMADRFWLPHVPVLLLAAALGAGAQWKALRRATRLSGRLLAAIMAVACAAGLAAEWPDDAFWMSRNPNAYYGLRDAGEWLAPRVAPDTRIGAYKPFASFWAGCAFTPYPAGVGTTALLDEMESAGVAFLVVNVHVARLLVPTLQPLLRTPLDPAYADRVRVVAAFRYEPEDHSTVILRLISGAGGEPRGSESPIAP